MVALTAATLALYRLAEEWLGSRAAARRTVLYLAVFPFFFTRVYTASVFLLVSVMAVAGAYRGRWWSGGGVDGADPSERYSHRSAAVSDGGA